MRFGLSMFVTDETIAPVELGRAAEDAGFDALFVPEHTHIPASRESPWSGGTELPRQYWHTLDPFVALSAIAATTQRLRLGTGIALIVERDPILLAKEAATLDVVSGGRFELGIGAGWNFEEMRNHGTDPDARFRVMRERALAIRAIWTQEEPSFHGEHADVDRRDGPSRLRSRARVRRRVVSQHARPRRARAAGGRAAAPRRRRRPWPRAGHLLRPARSRRGEGRQARGGRRRPRAAHGAAGRRRRDAALPGALCRAR
jgi:probable F420-dependent oxidoreductase